MTRVAWSFCRAWRTTGEAAKFAREVRENERRSREKHKNRRFFKLLPPQSPRGFSALARLYYLARRTKTTMLRRLVVSQLFLPFWHPSREPAIILGVVIH